MSGDLGLNELERRRLFAEGFSRDAIRLSERFGHDAALLYPYLEVENAVRTPRGLGTVLASNADGAVVLHMQEREMLDAGKKNERRVTRVVPLGT